MKRRSGSDLDLGCRLTAMGLLQWWLAVVVVWAGGVEGRALLSAKHKFKESENVPLFANKVGPFHNPRCVPLRFPGGFRCCR